MIVDRDAVSGNLTGSFFIDGKPIKVTKRNNVPVSTSTPIERRSQSDVIEDNSGICPQSGDVDTKLVEENPMTIFSQLPALELLDDVRTLGCVFYVSPEGMVWFSPESLESTLDMINDATNLIESEEGLTNFLSEQVELPNSHMISQHTGCVTRHLVLYIIEE